MQTLESYLKDSYILCFYEGGAEECIINILLDNNCLLFEKSDLVGEKIHPRRKVKEIERIFLNKDYEKNVVILRIIDSSSEKFKLSKPYNEMYQVKSCLTKPEIEILVIIDMKKLKEFDKEKSTTKPSVFCKDKLKLGEVKRKTFMEEYFDIDRLIIAIKEYHRIHKNKDSYSLYDLLNYNCK